MNTTSADAYLRDGCGRCEHYRTPACKVHLWTEPLVALRALLLASGLVEEMKWGSPCYTLDGKNVVMLTSLRRCCALSFFKGVALDDDDGLLTRPGPNSRFMRLLEFRSMDEVSARRASAERLIQQAIEVTRAGTQVTPSGAPESMPVELEQRLEADAVLSRAFEALTPGRRRSYFLYVSGAKRAETRERRVERCVPKIIAGKGFNER